MGSIDTAVSTPDAPLKLAYGFAFADLYDSAALPRLDEAFCGFLSIADEGLRDRLTAARAAPALAAKDESDLLLALAPHLDDFLAVLFRIAPEVAALRSRHDELAPLYTVKRLFVQRRAMHRVKPGDAQALDGDALRAELEVAMSEPFSELAYARRVSGWLEDEAACARELELAMRYAAWAVHTGTGRARHHSGVLFKAPHKLDPQKLVPTSADATRGYTEHRLPAASLRNRNGFALTDPGTDLTGALDQTSYCIWCHEQGKDSCSRGMREKGATGRGAASFKKNALGATLAGCPLEEKISEFQKTKSQGLALAALAIIAVDNPMCAATGHRICNDCMKACIYQKQEPVNIPEAETRTLKDVLALPWGFEIYSLLTRWNPLNLKRPYPARATGRKVLIAGMGPAGFSLAHYLMNDGHTVVGIDGLKIEPLPAELCGVDAHGARVAFRPIRDAAELAEPLDDRVMAGFGGVAEYGITVRWDKNFLKIVRLLLQRRSAFALFGGVRFGGTITTDDAFAMGFDHVALAIGAGRPTVLDLPNGLARGVRTASDFLMALQLTGAAKSTSIANMQLRLPVVVVGGGLTAIDAATESLAYYPMQVEKFLQRYETLQATCGPTLAAAFARDDEREIADELVGHARALREEKAAALREGRAPKVLELLQSWGGVTIAYRKGLAASPSYTLNHEEVQKALEEGIAFAEDLTPIRVEIDAQGSARALVARSATGAQVELPARTILVAAGTQPNTVLAREEPEHFALDGRYFQALDENGDPVAVEKAISKPRDVHMLVAKRPDGRCVSHFGDLHASFAGNVVKAIASAKQGHPIVTRALARIEPASADTEAAFLAKLHDGLHAVVHRVARLTPNIVEVVVRAPLAARRFQPGQFYRLQNFETRAQSIAATRLAMEGLALTGAWVDRERGLISTIVLEMGGSSDLCALLREGEPVVLMGPTGTPTEIPADETVVLVGGGLGNAVLFSIGQAMRRAGCRVLYFAGYKRIVDRYKIEEIEAAADAVVWCCDEAPGFAPRREQDRAYVGNIVDAMHAYATGALGAQLIALEQSRRLIAIGSDRMMAAVARARHERLQAFLPRCDVAIGSINSPMQCMMKEICAQCLQPHVDPATGETRYVFSCFNQDQPLDRVDWDALNSRLRQNAAQERLTSAWVAHCLRGGATAR